MKKPKIHKKCQLNGNSFSSNDELLLFAKGLSAATQQFLSDWFSDDDFITVHTSGSTGSPKSIKIRKEFMVNSAIATEKYFDLPEKTSALLCLSTEYIAGKMMLVRALVLGWKLDIVPPSSHPLQSDKKYDFVAMVPMQLYNSLKDLYKVTKVIVGGGVVSATLLEKLQGIKTEVFATYGMTETVTHIAVKRLTNYQLGSRNYELLPNINISQDHRGCLVIDAPKVAEGKVVTNDVVKIISKTAFKWLGRFDNVINSGGVKLHPEQIEEKLSKMIKQRFFVAGIPDAVLGEKLVLIVESRNKFNIQSQISNLSSLSKFEIPKEIYFLPKFIETKTKKIQRTKTLDLVLS